jgi:hypothetical protein
MSRVRRPSGLLDRLEAISKILLILGTITGGAWAIYEYLEKKQDTRVAESIGYVRRFSTEPLIGAQTRINPAFTLPRCARYQSSANCLACSKLSSCVVARKRCPSMDVLQCQWWLRSRL